METACRQLSDQLGSFVTGSRRAHDQMVRHAQHTQYAWWQAFQRLRDWLGRVMEQVEQAFDDLAGKIETVAAWIDDHVDPWLFGPAYLARSWADWIAVANGAARLAGAMDLSEVPGALEWKGAGADAYRASVASQQTAAIATETLVKALCDCLQTHLEGLLTFVTMMVDDLTKIMAKIAALAVKFAAAAAPPAWPTIISEAGAVVESCVTFEGDAIDKMIANIAHDVEAIARLQTDTDVVRALPGEQLAWPPVGVNIDAEPVGRLLPWHL